MSRPALFALLSIVAVTSITAGLLSGTVPVSAQQLIETLVHPVPGLVHDVIWELRAPRVLAAFACGGLLAFAGALLQVLLRNALADPYILGVSSGASLGALLAVTLGAGPIATNTAALASALAAIVIVFGVGFRSGESNVYRLLLTGVVLATGFSALVSLMLVMAPQAQVKGMLYWLMGDLADAGDPTAAWIVFALVIALGIAYATRLDLLALGETKARALGVAVPALRTGVFFSAALATVAAVMLGGAIGFIGLMAPHAIRLLGVAEHRALLPLAVLLGGGLLTVADTAARTLWAPQQLPVGVLTALIGVPAMLILLKRKT
ncbi:MAG: iron transporter permease [Burkholderiales bacterium]|jgi:iron complex transport system permease protein|nr:iron transporter permease [Burkholderiales bacterium]